MFFTSLTTPHFIFFFFFNDTATTEIYTFPYTTLFRSSRGGDSPLPAFGTRGRRKRAAAGSTTAHNGKFRSEEHTSELQSQSNLVCRLLLEKKKINSYALTLLKVRVLSMTCGCHMHTLL